MYLSEELKNLFKPKAVNPIGNESAKIYILIEPPNYTNYQEDSPLSKQDLILLSECLESSGLISNKVNMLDEVRISNALMHVPISKQGIKITTRYCTDKDIKELGILNLDDINKVNPDIILAFGSIATKILTNLEINYYETASRTSFQLNNKPVLFSKPIRKSLFNNSPKFLKKDLQELTGRFIQGKKLLSGESINTPIKGECVTLDIFEQEDMNKLEEIFFGVHTLVLDFEASGLKTYNEGFHIGGVGLTSLDETKAVYVHFYSFNRMFNGVNTPPSQNLELLVEFMKSKKMIAFNKTYELSVCASKSAGLNFNLRNCEDVLMWLRALNESSSLKEASVNKLGINKWTDGVDTWVNCINTFINENKPTVTMKGHRAQIDWLIKNADELFDLDFYYKEKFTNDLITDIKKINTNKTKVFKKLDIDYTLLKEYALDNVEKLKSSKNYDIVVQDLKDMNLPSMFKYERGRHHFLSKKDNKIIDAVRSLKDLIYSTYNQEDARSIGFKLIGYVVKILEDHESFSYASYADIPLEIVRPYCIDDCINTGRLSKICKQDLEDAGLVDCASIIDDHAYLAYIMSRNGIAWDEELAKDLHKSYEASQLESLRNLIFLLQKANALNIPEGLEIQCRTTSDISFLKTIFNPMSSYKYTGENEHKTVSLMMSNALGTSEFKIASFIYDAYEHSTALLNPDEASKQFPTMYPIYLEISKLDTPEECNNFIRDLLKNGKDLQNNMVESNKRHFRLHQENNLEIKSRMKYKDWKLTSLDQSNSEHLYNIFEIILKVNPDDDSTWTDEFWILYYFKLFKKINKSLGSYINGKTGRENVYSVKESEIYNIAPTRLESIKDSEKLEDEVYITNTSWGPCTVTTKRWSGAQHTVPKKTELMDLRTTRFGNKGVKIKFDYSQAEVRVLAKLAEDENLLKAFEGGLDAHRYNASLTFNKPMEDVTDTERSMAKGLTFSLLYGAGVSEFARMYTKGNIQEANNIISAFFEAYPNVKDFIDEMHKTGALYGEVCNPITGILDIERPTWAKLLSKSDLIKLSISAYDYSVDIPNIKDEEDERKQRAKFSKCMRNSQNYPIQSTSSLLAGLAIKQIQDKIESDGLNGKIECFTHDSCEMDVPLDEFIRTLFLIPDCSVAFLQERFGIPMKVDFEIGVSNNKLIGLDIQEITDTEIISKFEGKKSALLELQERLHSNGYVVEYEIQESKEKIKSIKDMFTTTLGYARDMGKTYEELKGTIVIKQG